MKEIFIKREILTELRRHLDRKEISLIIGPRQAGKTTVMQVLKRELERKCKKTLFLSLDFELDKRFFESQANLIKKINLEIGEGSSRIYTSLSPKSRGYVFIDEIQRKENAGLFLKGIYDLKLPYKFIVSGSGSLELKEKISESLVGRKRIFEFSTLSFKEFVNYKTDYKYEKKLPDFFAINKDKAKELFEEYLSFGGYPLVVLNGEISEKKKLINEIYQSYLEKDISYLLKIKKAADFNNLVKILAGQIGQLFNLTEISKTLGISLPTVKNYLWYLEKTFIIRRLTPYFRNIRKELIKTPVFYFCDLGLRNFSLGLFDRNLNYKELGFVFENFIFNILREIANKNFYKIYFWRTKDGAEVDFVLETGRGLIPIEAKCQSLTKPEIPRSFKSFIEKYQPSEAFLVNLSLDKTIKLNRTKVHFIPVLKLFFQDF